jgi:hypothetical protein
MVIVIAEPRTNYVTKHDKKPRNHERHNEEIQQLAHRAWTTKTGARYDLHY